MQSMATFVRQMFIDAGLDSSDVVLDRAVPGFYRRSKEWDVVAMRKGHLVGVVELKSQESSPGNNANNRLEEAVGSAVDAHTVQDYSGVYGDLGVWAAWCMTFNANCETGAPVGYKFNRAPLFSVDPEFEPMTYASQYEIAVQRFIATNVYNAAWMLTTWINADSSIGYYEPVPTATAATLRTQIEARVQFALQVLG
ncbi:hypothetical protein N798_16615 [Knoellia flava TL1]|nr:PaeR7I family type II restriction endonuclease [Knoellia flava]KGN28938.1 hypothetical protein N798_16615 [Knoellia flava TL1]